MKIDVRKIDRHDIIESLFVKILSGKFFIRNLIVPINILSVFVSWHFNHSIGWAIFHYLFGFWHLLWCLITYRFADGALLEILNSYI